MSEVRKGRPTLLGDSYVYLLRPDDKPVELPHSGSPLPLLQKLHAAMSTR